MFFHFMELPKDIKFKILSYLPVNMSTRVFRVNKSLYNITHNETFCHIKLLNDTPDYSNAKSITVTNKEHYLATPPKYLAYKSKHFTNLFNSLVTDNQFVLVEVPYDKDFVEYFSDDEPAPRCGDCGDDYYVSLNYIEHRYSKNVCKACIHRQNLELGLRS